MCCLKQAILGSKISTDVNLIVLEVHNESCSLQSNINADTLHKCTVNPPRAPVYIYACPPDIKNSNCINVNYTWRVGCPNKIEAHNTDCQRRFEIHRRFSLLLLHNCPKCNAVFFPSNKKTAPIGGQKDTPALDFAGHTAPCWLWSARARLDEKIHPNEFKRQSNSNMAIAWQITGVVQNALAANVASTGPDLKEMSGVLSGAKKSIDLQRMVIILTSLTVTFPPDKAIAFKIFIKVLTKEMTYKFLLH